jgi:hypothetical protein
LRVFGYGLPRLNSAWDHRCEERQYFPRNIDPALRVDKRFLRLFGAACRQAAIAPIQVNWLSSSFERSWLRRAWALAA